MKAKTILYWIKTSLIALETFLGGVIDLTRGRTGIVSGPFVIHVVRSLGYTAYMLAILGIFKIPGAITIVVPGFLRLKEWAYAGIVFELSGAAASQAACDNWGNVIAPLSLLGLAIASWALRPANRILGTLFPAHQPIVRALPLRSDSTTGATIGIAGNSFEAQDRLFAKRGLRTTFWLKSHADGVQDFSIAGDPSPKNGSG